MGVIINEVCCINITNMYENDPKNYQPQYTNGNGNDTYKKISNFESKIYNDPSQIKNLPLNEIKLIDHSNSIGNENISSTKLPISTQNVIRKLSGNPLDQYDIIKNIGKGTFGTVYKVLHKQTGIIRAMKVIPKNNLKYGFTDEDISQEINILKKLEHPHIIKLFEFYTFKKNYYLINEFCTEGDLSEKLSELGMFPEFFVKILMIQIFNAVLYLNQKKVIHGDLKLENIMIDSCITKAELTKENTNKFNFIQSLLEDERDINDYLKQNELKRSSTFHDFGNKNFMANKKLKEGIKKMEHFDNIKSQDKSLKVQVKRDKTIISSNYFKNNNKKTFKNLENEDNNHLKVIKETKKKSDFSYLNGEEDDDDNNNSFKSSNGSDEKIENGKNKVNNIKVYNQKLINSQLQKEKIIKRHKELLKSINESSDTNLPQISPLKKTLTLKSMKMKNFELKLIDFGCAKIFSKYKKN